MEEISFPNPHSNQAKESLKRSREKLHRVQSKNGWPVTPKPDDRRERDKRAHKEPKRKGRKEKQRERERERRNAKDYLCSYNK